MAKKESKGKSAGVVPTAQRGTVKAPKEGKSRRYNMDNENMSVPVQVAQQALNEKLSALAINMEAAADLAAAVATESYEDKNNIERVFYRDSEGKMLLTEQEVIDHLRATRGTYFADSGNTAAGVNGANVKSLSTHTLENKAINILKDIEAGKIEHLEPEQKAILRSSIAGLKNNLGGISTNKLGDYDAMTIHRLAMSVGGMIQ